MDLVGTQSSFFISAGLKANSPIREVKVHHRFVLRKVSKVVGRENNLP